MDDDFKVIIIPNYLNPDAPKGENLILLFTIQEMERARRRAELTINARMEKGVSRDDAIRSIIGGTKLS